MTKSELEQLLKQQNETLKKVFDNTYAFKSFLNLNDDVYKNWTIAKEASNILTGMVIGGLLGGGITFLFGMGTVTQILFVLGISNPLMWPIILSAIGGGVLFYGKDKMLQKIQKDLFHIIPKRINTPLDYLGEQIIEAFLVKLPSLYNEACIVSFFTTHGYNPEFIKFKLKQVKNNKDKLKKNNYKKIINKIGEKENIPNLYSIIEKNTNFC